MHTEQNGKLLAQNLRKLFLFSFLYSPLPTRNETCIWIEYAALQIELK